MTSTGLVIFDNDGVLVDSETLTVEFEVQTLADLGIVLTPEEVVATFMGRSLAFGRAWVDERAGNDAADRYEQALRHDLAAVFEERLRPVPGVEATLNALAARGVPVCVASSGTPEGIARKLALTGLADYFGDHVFSAGQVEHGKPAPDLFLLAAGELAVDPTACVVVEDSVPGVTAAVAAGMRPVGYAAGLAPAGALAAAGATEIAALRDLLGLL